MVIITEAIETQTKQVRQNFVVLARRLERHVGLGAFFLRVTRCHPYSSGSWLWWELGGATPPATTYYHPWEAGHGVPPP
jgi:hypothetical protein